MQPDNMNNSNHNTGGPSVASLIVYGLMVIGFAFVAAPFILAIHSSSH